MDLRAEVVITPERNLKAESALHKLNDVFVKHDIDYFIIGSAARVAYMGYGTPSNDIDILIPETSQRQKAEELIASLKQAHPDIFFDTSLSKLIEKDSGNTFHLKYGAIDIPIKSSLMETRKISLNGTEINTLPPATLLHTYSLVGGPFREKDWRQSIEFAKWMRSSAKYDHRDYETFHEFSNRRWRGSPLRKMQYFWREAIKALPANVRSAIVNKLYNTPAVLQARYIFNSLEDPTSTVDP